MKQDLEKQREETAKHFAERLTKYLWSEVNGTSPVVKVAPCELSTDYSVLLEMNDYRAYSPADLDSIDSMDNEVAWETETRRVGDHLLVQIRRQIALRNKSEGNNILLSGDLADARKAILGDMYNIVRETKRVIETKKGLSSGDARHPYHSFPKDIKDVLVIIGDVIEVRLKQIEKREETRE